MTDSDPRSKKFRLRADQIRPVATRRGACIATDRITVDGHPVCYAYREAPDFDVDSGWRFFAGDESQEYVDNPTNSTIYEINTIANYDPDIVAILDAPAPAAYQRSGRGEQFATVPYPAEVVLRLSSCGAHQSVSLPDPADLNPSSGKARLAFGRFPLLPTCSARS